jgi:pimeloyl-ACP methyl ester carboxylesterase
LLLPPHRHNVVGMDFPPFETGELPTADGAEKPFVKIGGGPRAMVVVPGAADGLRTCVDVAVYLAWFYRERAKEFRLLVLSRREPIPRDFGVERHAEDMIRTLEELEYGPAVWECLSAAGPIGQQIAVKRPALVQGLILSSSYDYVGERTRRVLKQWLGLAQHPGGADAFSGMIEQKYRPPAEVLAIIDARRLEQAATSRSPERLARILEELFDLDQRALTPHINCPALVIGGENDRAVPADVQRELATRIPRATLKLCPGFGHFNDMENSEYQNYVEQFAKSVTTSVS